MKLRILSWLINGKIVILYGSPARPVLGATTKLLLSQVNATPAALLRLIINHWTTHYIFASKNNRILLLKKRNPSKVQKITNFLLTVIIMNCYEFFLFYNETGKLLKSTKVNQVHFRSKKWIRTIKCWIIATIS